MINLATTISNTIKNGFRTIKSKTLGQNTATGETVTQGGIDFNPLKNMKAVYATTSNSSEPVCIGYLNKSIIDDLEQGEIAFYSTDGKTPSAFIKARKDGNIEINGDADNAIGFIPLNSSWTELITEINAFITIFNAHVHPVPTASALSIPPAIGTTAITSTPATLATTTITSAKVDSVKLP